MARLDQDRPNENGAYANSSELTPGDRALLESETGRAPPAPENASTARDEEIRDKSGGVRPTSDDAASHLAAGATETDDGLDETLEAVRRAAENVSEDDLEAGRDEPVFDKADRA